MPMFSSFAAKKKRLKQLGNMLYVALGASFSEVETVTPDGFASVSIKRRELFLCRPDWNFNTKVAL